MPIPLYVILAVFVVGLASFILLASSQYLRFRSRRVVTCPETKRPAGVEVDTWHAALGPAFGGPRLRVVDCSRWPERADCGQQCLAEIETSPENCLVRTIVSRWYEGKSCVLCGKPFGPIVWSQHSPALMTSERRTREWREIPAIELHETLQTHFPVCWDCHIIETVRRTHPNLIVYGPRPEAREHLRHMLP